MTGTISMVLKHKDAGNKGRQRQRTGYASRPGPSIPRGVAPQQSSTPLPRTTSNINHKELSRTTTLYSRLHRCPWRHSRRLGQSVVALRSPAITQWSGMDDYLIWTALPRGAVVQKTPCQALWPGQASPSAKPGFTKGCVGVHLVCTETANSTALDQTRKAIPIHNHTKSRR